MTNRYYTPLIYKDGNGKDRNVKLTFELDPVELMDWVFDNPFDANELLGSLAELREIEKEDSRNLTEEEVRTMLGVIKLLAQISAGRPTEDGEYFIKDPNWISSYAYRGFRTFLLTHPNETTQFLNTLLDNDVMEEFVKAVGEANEKADGEAPAEATNSDSGPDTVAKMQARIKELEARGNVTQLPTPPSE